MSSLQSMRQNLNIRLKNLTDRILKQGWINIGLRAKMGLMVEVGLVALISVFLFLGVSTARQTTQKILSERMMLARLSAASLDSTIRQIQGIMGIINETNLARTDVDGLKGQISLLDTVYLQLSNASSQVLLMSGTGEIIASAGSSEAILEEAEKNALRSMVANLPPPHEPSLVTLDTEVIRPVILTQVAHAADSRDPNILAVILDLEGSDFLPLRNAIDLGQTGKLDVVDSEGRVLISSHPDSSGGTGTFQEIWSRLFIAGKPSIETCLGCSELESEENPDEVIAFAPLTQVPWGVIVRQKASELMAPVNRLFIQTLLLGAFTIIGALLLVWVTTNSVIRPVQELKEATERIAGGDLETPIRVSSLDWLYKRAERRDEIGELAESFSMMRRQLKRSIDEVNDLNSELDARVQDRTQAALKAQLEAQTARDDLRSIIDALNDELIVVNVNDLSIQLANRITQEQHPDPVGLLGQSCAQVCHQDRSNMDFGCECPIPAVVSTGNSVKVTHEISAHNNGRKIYKEITASPLLDINGQIGRVVELTRDVTAEKELEESLIRRNQELSILNAIAFTVNQSLDLEEILNQSLETLLKLTEIDIGAIFLNDNMGGELRLRAYRGISQKTAQYAAELGMLDGSCGGVVERGRIMIVPDISRFKSKRARNLQRENIKTLAHIPLKAKGSILGSMCVGTCNLREFNEEEQNLLSAISSQIAIAIENSRLYAEVQRKERLRGELFMKVISAQEEERKRIARELHDETSQSLAALIFAVEENLEMDRLDQIHDRLKWMHDLTQHTLDGVHKLIFDLRPSVLDHLGLVPAIRWFAETRLQSKGVRISLEDFSNSHRFPPEVETALFRVVQEAIVNIARHSAARNVLIRFSEQGKDVQVQIEDDGVGFDASLLTPELGSLRGIGLRGMQERLELLGGQLEISSMPGSGTCLTIYVPIEQGSMQNA